MLPSPLTCHTLPFKNTPARACGNTTASSPCFSFRKWTVISKLLQIRKFYTHTPRPTPRHEGGVRGQCRECLPLLASQGSKGDIPAPNNSHFIMALNFLGREFGRASADESSVPLILTEVAWWCSAGRRVGMKSPGQPRARVWCPSGEGWGHLPGACPA